MGFRVEIDPLKKIELISLSVETARILTTPRNCIEENIYALNTSVNTLLKKQKPQQVQPECANCLENHPTSYSEIVKKLQLFRNEDITVKYLVTLCCKK